MNKSEVTFLIQGIVSCPPGDMNEIYSTQQGAKCHPHMIFKPKHTQTLHRHTIVFLVEQHSLSHSHYTYKEAILLTSILLYASSCHNCPSCVGRSRYSRHRHQAGHLIQCLKLTRVDEQGPSVLLCSYSITEPAEPKTGHFITDTNHNMGTKISLAEPVILDDHLLYRSNQTIISQMRNIHTFSLT